MGEFLLKYNILFLLLLITILAEPLNVTKENKESTCGPQNFVKNTTNSTLTSIDLKNLSSKVQVNQVCAGKHNESEKSNISLQIMPRVSRNSPKDRLECISCFGSGISASDDDCYSGKSSERAKCAESETCYIELHPQYIKRGCMLPSSINRTFVCKCPLCNDKPAADSTYYEYKNIDDWQFDNEHLEEPIAGLDLLCKVCETTGQNHISDQICRNGSGTNYMLCGTNQLCFTNFISHNLFVSRGCTIPPAFNTIKFYCSIVNCNSEPYDNPTRNRRSIAYKLLQSDPYKKEKLEIALSKAHRSLIASKTSMILKMFLSAIFTVILAKSIHQN